MLQEVNKKHAAEVEAQRKRENDAKQAAEAALKVRLSSLVTNTLSFAWFLSATLQQLLL